MSIQLNDALSGCRLDLLQINANTARFELFAPGNAIPVLSCDYADFTPISTTVPWELQTGRFIGIKCCEKDNGVAVKVMEKDFLIQDFFHFHDGRLEINRVWQYRGTGRLENVVVGSRITAGNGINEKITIPHVIYNDNPGAAPERLVPHLHKEPGYSLILEEHRLPVPAVNVEWQNGTDFAALTLFAQPSATPSGEFWSLGGIHAESGLEIVSLSGVVSFNNQKDFLYGSQNDAYHQTGFGLLTLAPGETLRKTIIIDFVKSIKEGRGFTRIVEAGMDILRPQAHPVLTLEEIIALKKNALLRRWRENLSGAGFTWISEKAEEGNVYRAPPGFLFGWVGQSLRLAWCALKFGVSAEKDWLEKAIAVIDNFAGAPEAGNTPGLKYLYHDYAANRWYSSEDRAMHHISSRMTGESLANLAECLLLLKQHGGEIKPAWVKALRRGLDFLTAPQRLTANGIFPFSFRTDGTPDQQDISGAGTACIDAILAAAAFFDDREPAACGTAILERYYEIFGKTLMRPFSCATLDASCEDKESGIYFFLAAYRAFKLTGSEAYAEYARLGAEWISTFVYQWNTPFKPGSVCADNGFESVFWPGVSIQNMHLDVFFPAYEVYDFGIITKNKTLSTIGLGVMSAWSHGIARYPGHWGFPIPGEQGEQFNHTNYFQGPFTIVDWRGSANNWNPSWIIAMVLQAAIKFNDTSVKSTL